MGERVAARIEKHRPKAGPWPAAGTVATCAAVGIHRAGTAQWTGTARAAVVDSLSLYMPREDAEAAVPHDLGADDDGPASNLDGAERAIILEGTAYRLDGVPVAHEVIAGAPTWQNANGTWHRLQPGADAPELLNRDGQWEDAGHPWAEHLEAVQAEHGRVASQLENDEQIATLRASGGAETLYGPSPSPFDFSSADPVEAAAASGPGANRSGGTVGGRWCRSTLRRFARRSRRILPTAGSGSGSTRGSERSTRRRRSSRPSGRQCGSSRRTSALRT